MIEEILEKLRHRLLDLTSRNRLLNFKHPKGTSLKFEVQDISEVYKRIVEEQLAIRIDGVPVPDQRPRPDVLQHIKSTGWKSRNDLSVLTYEDTLLAQCRKIEREANTSISETGTNTLFLILGFLEYQESCDSSVDMLAPLVSIPVRLDRRVYHNTQKYYIQSNGEEIQENLSLREKFKRDFNIALPDFDVEKFSFEDYMLNVKSALRTQSTFSVKYNASLGFLSFSGMLMIKDLDLDSWNYGNGNNRLIEHSVLKELFGNIEFEPENADFNFHDTELHDVDKYNTSRIPLVYDADHSQHSALIDVLEHEKNIVIQGPPGTGKSQTITNIIAGAIDKGKTVLFVAEKLAALEVVKYRLDQVGLSPLILELHSDKANKKYVLESLEKRLNHKYKHIQGIEGDMDSLQVSINELNRYADNLGEIIQSELQLSLYATIWRFIRLKELSLPDIVLTLKYDVADAHTLTRTELDNRIDTLVAVGKALRGIGFDVVNHPYFGFYPEVATPGIMVELTSIIRHTNEKLAQLLPHARQYDEILKSAAVANSKKILQQIEELKNWNQNTKAIGAEGLINLISSYCDNNGRFKAVASYISKLEKEINEYNSVVLKYSSLIKDDFRIQSSDSDTLGKYSKECKQYDVSYHINELRKTSSDFRVLAQKTYNTHTEIANILSDYSLEYEPSTTEMRKWTDLLNVLREAPLTVLHYQSPKLCQKHSESSIIQLINLKNRINEIEKSLHNTIYFDQLPSKSELSNAIRVLRVGTEWYRYINAEFRQSISLHKSINKANRSYSARERLQELELLMELIESKEKWSSSKAWSDIIESQPDMDYNLESLRSLCAWNNRISNCFPISIDKLDYALLEKFISIVRDNRLQKMSILFSQLNSSVVQLINTVSSLGSEVSRKGYLSVAESYLNFAESIGKVSQLVDSHNVNCTSVSQFQSAIKECLKAKSIYSSMSNSTEYTWLGSTYQGVQTDVSILRKCVEHLDDIHNLSIPSEFKYLIASSKPQTTAKELISILEKTHQCYQLLDSFESKVRDHGTFSLNEWSGTKASTQIGNKIDNILSKGEIALRESESIHAWIQYWSLRKQAVGLKVEAFVEGMEAGIFHPDDIHQLYAYAFYNSLLSNYFRMNPSFDGWTRERLEQLRNNLSDRDRSLIKQRGHAIAEKFKRFEPKKLGNPSTYIDQKTEFNLVRHLLGQQRPRVPIRKLLQRAPVTMQQLKPCFMMSPQSVVKYLAPNQIEFDLLVMDEASQLRPEEAISAIVRAKQVVVVGDSKQLPPTSFFKTNVDDSLEDDDEATSMTDTESILEVGARAFGNIRSLGVHYRSKHHTLISFSNQKFYDDRLLLFPSPYELNLKYGVRAIYVADSWYEKGINPIEAQKVVDLIIHHLKHRSGESLGVAAVNLRQRDLIDELLDLKLSDYVELAKLKDSLPEPLFIKNLENVQGDERDVIIVSTTYGPRPNSSVVQQRFGPIGYENGWRRLNVLFTRARSSLILCTSLRPHDIVVDENSKLGIKIFKQYLEYIQRGCVFDHADVTDEPENAFEESVIKVLEAEGYQVVPQLGAAGYRIDIAVRHPEYPGIYLAAIECDGATYHSSRSARERDRIRQEVLEQIGWKGKIWRIWSTDWYKRPNIEKRKLLEFLQSKLAESEEVYELVNPWETTASASNDGYAQKSTVGRQVDHQLDLVTEEISQAIFESEVVEIGDSITYRDIDRLNDVYTATIVRGESDALRSRYKYDSPFASVVLGSSIGDIVELQLKDKVKKFEILQIEKPSVD